MCPKFGTPKNNKFSIWNKWKIYYFKVSQYLSTLWYLLAAMLQLSPDAGNAIRNIQVSNVLVIKIVKDNFQETIKLSIKQLMVSVLKCWQNKKKVFFSNECDMRE